MKVFIAMPCYGAIPAEVYLTGSARIAEVFAGVVGSVSFCFASSSAFFAFASSQDLSVGITV